MTCNIPKPLQYHFSNYYKCGCWRKLFPSKISLNCQESCMVNLECRIQSFGNRGPRIRQMAEAGFYSVKDGVKCFYCHGVIPRPYYEIPLRVHVQNFPNCTFAVESLKKKEQVGHFTNMQRESIRLKTFFKWTRQLDPKLLVKNGLFYELETDMLICVYCRVKLDARASDIINFHKNLRPLCVFVIAWTYIKLPMHIEMADPLKRLKSFDGCFDYVPNLLEVVKSGFYYTSRSVQCFWCEFEIDTVQMNNVFQIHSQESPDCLFGRNACFQVPDDKCMITFEKKMQISYSQWGRIKISNLPLDCCIICSETERQVAFSTCGHFICCKSCAKRLYLCPMCRKPVEKTINIYKS